MATDAELTGLYGPYPVPDPQPADLPAVVRRHQVALDLSGDLISDRAGALSIAHALNDVPGLVGEIARLRGAATPPQPDLMSEVRDLIDLVEANHRTRPATLEISPGGEEHWHTLAHGHGPVNVCRHPMCAQATYLATLLRDAPAGTPPANDAQLTEAAADRTWRDGR